MVLMNPLELDVDPGLIYSAAISPERIFIVVLASGNVQSFSLEGQQGLTIGKKGQGPGEFGFPVAVFYDAPYLYVADNGKQKLFRIDPESGVFLDDWHIDPINALFVRKDTFLISYNMKQQKGMFALGEIKEELETQSFFFEDPCCLSIKGSKRSGALIDHDGNVWVAYSGEFRLAKYSRSGKQLLKINASPHDYVTPSPYNTNRFDQKASAVHFRSFDKIAGIYEIEGVIALYRFKSGSERRLDLFTKAGEFQRSLPIDNFEPVGVYGGALYFLMKGTASDPWDLRIAQMGFQ